MDLASIKLLMLAGSTSDALPGVHVSRNPASRALPSRSWSADRCVCAYPHAGGTVRINLVCYNTFSFSTSAQALEAPSIDIKKRVERMVDRLSRG